MKIWKLGCDVDNFESLAWGNNEYDIDLDFIHSFNGTPKENKWKIIQLERMNENTEWGNIISLSSHIPVMDKTAVNALQEYLKGNVEILPIICEDKQFFIINILRVIDCIDYQKAEYKTFRDGIRIMRFTKYAFKEKKIKNKHIFKIKDEPLRTPFVSDEFRKKVLENKLTGFTFELVWDNDK